MPTVIEHTHSDGNSGAGNLLAVVLLIVFAIAFLLYGLPYIGNAFRGPSVSVPSNIDVNLHNTK